MRTTNALCMCAAFFSVAAPALADTNLATTINYTNGPVQIETCKAWLSDTSVGNRNYYISQAVSFENGASQPIVAVRFAFQVLDPFGQSCAHDDRRRDWNICAAGSDPAGISTGRRRRQFVDCN